MRGFYIWCRVWTGFTDAFPWFVELNDLDDDQLVAELNGRARNWLRENKSAARKRYQDEKDALRELAGQASKRAGRCAVRGLPSMSLYEKGLVKERLARLNRQELLNEANQYGLQIAMPDPELRKEILIAKEREYLEHEYRRQRRECEQLDQDVRHQFDVKRRVRGDRAESRLETRIARLAGWTIQDIPYFGGIWPTPKLMLRWVETEDDLGQLLKIARVRFQYPTWDLAPTFFGVQSCADMTDADVAELEIGKRDSLDENSKWIGTPLFQAVLSEFDRIASHLEFVTQRDSGVSGEQAGEVRSESRRGATADQIAADAGREYFTIRELAKVSGLSEDAVEGRIRRWAQRNGIPESTYRVEFPEASSGLARYMYRIQPIWTCLVAEPEISQKNIE